MAAHGFSADAEPRGDIGVPHAFTYAVKHVALPRRQAIALDQATAERMLVTQRIALARKVAGEQFADHLKKLHVRRFEVVMVASAPNPEIAKMAFLANGSIDGMEIHAEVQAINGKEVIEELGLLKRPLGHDLVDVDRPPTSTHMRGDRIAELKVVIISRDVVTAHIDEDRPAFARDFLFKDEGCKIVGLEQLKQPEAQLIAHVATRTIRLEDAHYLQQAVSLACRQGWRHLVSELF